MEFIASCILTTVRGVSSVRCAIIIAFFSVIFVSVAVLAPKPALAANALSLLLKGPNSDAVYRIDNMSKRVFADIKTYLTWYDGFSDVLTVPVTTLDTYTTGAPVPFRPGTKLVTYPNTARVYAVESGGVLRWIPSETIATSLYGAGWAKRVRDVHELTFGNYTIGASLTAGEYPEGILLIEAGHPEVYLVEKQELRRFSDGNAFLANGYKWEDLVIVATLPTFKRSTNITGFEQNLGRIDVPASQSISPSPSTTPGGGGGGRSVTPPVITPPSTPPDTTAPILSMSGAADLTSDSAIITWTTNESASSGVEYGITLAYGSAKLNATPVTAHTVSLSGLAASTLYHYRVTSCDAAGNCATSADRTFATSAVVDSTAPIISGTIARGATDRTVTITWATDEVSDSVISYGSSANYGSSISDTSTVASHSLQISNLTPQSTYHFKVTSCDAAGNCTSSADATFMTVANPDTTAPAISNTDSGSITQNAATISWTTDENANSRVDYGATASYGSNALSAPFVLSRSLVLNSLTLSTLYHFKVTSCDAAGNCASSADAMFTTVAPVDTTAPVLSNIATSGIANTTATIGWMSDENADSKVDYGTTTAYGFQSVSAFDVTNHSMNLAGLTAGTLYHYRLTSCDAAGNCATSADVTFTTTGGSTAIIPFAPTIMYPSVTEGTTNSKVNPTIFKSVFDSPTALVTQLDFETEVATDNSFSNVVWRSVKGMGAGMAIMVNDESGRFLGTHTSQTRLNYGTTYYVRARQQQADTNKNWSPWSTVVSFSTITAYGTAGGGQTFYVATAGSNVSSCGSGASPCASLAYVLKSKVVNNRGDEVIVKAGTYMMNEYDVNFDDFPNSVMIRGEDPAHRPVFKASYVEAGYGWQREGYFVARGANDVVFQDLVFRGNDDCCTTFDPNNTQSQSNGIYLFDIDSKCIPAYGCTPTDANGARRVSFINTDFLQGVMLVGDINGENASKHLLLWNVKNIGSPAVTCTFKSTGEPGCGPLQINHRTYDAYTSKGDTFITISGADFDNHTNHVSANNWENVLLEKVQYYRGSIHPFRPNGASRNWTVRRVIVGDNVEGLNFTTGDGSVTNLVVENSTFIVALDVYDNGAAPGTIGYFVVRNNIFRNRRSGLEVSDCGTNDPSWGTNCNDSGVEDVINPATDRISVDYNLYYSYINSDIITWDGTAPNFTKYYPVGVGTPNFTTWKGLGYDVHSPNPADPLFVNVLNSNPGNHRDDVTLLAGSPAMNAGHPDYAVPDATGKLQASATQGGSGRVDLGAIEGTGSGPVDNTAPLISGVTSASITAAGATISWTTNEYTDTQVEYGLTMSYGSSTTLNSSLIISHSVSLVSLSANTLYHYRVTSRDGAGNVATSGDYTFTTIGSDTTAPIISGVSSGSITASTASVSWITDESSDTQVEYGLTAGYGSSTTLDTSLVISHSASLSGLVTNTLYHYRVKSKDAAGNLRTSTDATFATLSNGGGSNVTRVYQEGSAVCGTTYTGSRGAVWAYNSYTADISQPCGKQNTVNPDSSQNVEGCALVFPNIIGANTWQIPIGATVQSATLEFNAFSYNVGQSVTVRLYQFTDPSSRGLWSGSGISMDYRDKANTASAWLSRNGDFAATPVTEMTFTYPNPANYVTTSFNVTTAVQSWASGAPNHGVSMFIPSSSQSRYEGIGSSTSDPSSRRPKLTIVTNETNPPASCLP